MWNLNLFYFELIYSIFLLSQLWQVSDNLWKTDCYPVDRGHQLEVLCTLDLRPVCTGYLLSKLVVYSVEKLNVEDNLYFLDHFLISSTPYEVYEIQNYWRNHQRWSMEKAFLQHFVIFKGIHLCWSLFLIKLQAFSPATLLKGDSNTRVFSVNNVIFLKTPLVSASENGNPAQL